MAKLVGAVNVSHSPFCYMTSENWALVQERRVAQKAYRSDLVLDDLDAHTAKKAKVDAAMATLRRAVDDMRPDVLVVIGDDQEEMYEFTNYPAVAVYVGEEFKGFVASAATNFMHPGVTKAGDVGAEAPQQQAVPGHPGFAAHLLTGLMEKGFDPSFMLGVPEHRAHRGMAHAIMRPIDSLSDFSVPSVPLLLNAYYAPQLTGLRCYQVGQALRQLIDSYPDDLRVVAVGSGGLWHTPGKPGSYVNEAFDRKCLEHLAAGDAKGFAEHFDAYVPPADDRSQDVSSGGAGAAVTGLQVSTGPQGGSRETVEWVAAAATCEGRPWEVVDYVVANASPAGLAFAYCADV